MDILADILSITRLAGDVFCHTWAEPPWALRFDPGPDVRLHLIAAGSCLLVPTRGRSVALGPHDLVLLPQGGGHVLCDHPASPQVSLDQFRAQSRRSNRPVTLITGPRVRDRRRTELICGSYTLAFAKTHPVLRLLPAVIHIPGHAAMRHLGLQGTLQLLLREFTDRDVGSAKVVSLLLEVLFVHVLRHWLDTQPQGSTGWLGALRDEPIGRALVLIHTSPERDWTVQSLASEVGMSRPVFARRFTDKVADTPLGYLRKLRIDLATRLLHETDQPLAAIAASVGIARVNPIEYLTAVFPVLAGRVRLIDLPALLPARWKLRGVAAPAAAA
jgi:AraC-like DNA-binding protein